VSGHGSLELDSEQAAYLINALTKLRPQVPDRYNMRDYETSLRAFYGLPSLEKVS
jgi:hypothetical protein